jgi:hypothetical protein
MKTLTVLYEVEAAPVYGKHTAHFGMWRSRDVTVDEASARRLAHRISKDVGAFGRRYIARVIKVERSVVAEYEVRS